MLWCIVSAEEGRSRSNAALLLEVSYCSFTPMTPRLFPAERNAAFLSSGRARNRRPSPPTVACSLPPPIIPTVPPPEEERGGGGECEATTGCSIVFCAARTAAAPVPTANALLERACPPPRWPLTNSFSSRGDSSRAALPTPRAVFGRVCSARRGPTASPVALPATTRSTATWPCSSPPESLFCCIRRRLGADADRALPAGCRAPLPRLPPNKTPPAPLTP